MTRYRLAKRLGVNESLLSRTYNGKSDPGFNEVSRWLGELGYAFSIVTDESRALENATAYDVNSFGKKLSLLDIGTYDYLEVHRMLKQVLESHAAKPSPPVVFFLPERIPCEEWRAFYAATIAYLYKNQMKQAPRFASPASNKAKNSWCPIRKLGRSHTAFDETYLDYNILLPKGELTWI
ncbi:MAG: hypothetical protein FWD72_02095 [Eggerthellaceae bacterium]|nr:hypothetical protein [Eggerthellaceae bacterium]